MSRSTTRARISRYYLNGSTDGSNQAVSALTYTFNSAYSLFPIVMAGDENGAVVPPGASYPGSFATSRSTRRTSALLLSLPSPQSSRRDHVVHVL